MKIRRLGAELLHAGRRPNGHRQTEGRTDMKKLIFAFRNFVNTPECYDKSDETVFSGTKTPNFAHTVSVLVSYVPYDKQELFLYTALTVCSL